MSWRALVVMVSAVVVAACDDTADLLAEGRVADACFHARNAPAERALVEQWFVEHAPVRVDVVDQATLAAALGAPVHVLGNGPIAWDVDGTIAAVPDARIALDVRTEAPLSSLVERLPPMAVADRAPVPAVIDPSSLLPTPRPTYRSWGASFTRDPIGSFIEGTVAVGTAVGTAIGFAVVTPIVAMGSVIGGFFDAIGSIFGGGQTAPPERLPLLRLQTEDGAVADALLDAREVEAANITLSAEHADAELAQQTERTRRLALLDDPNVLGPGDCSVGRCRLMLDTPPSTVPARFSVERQRFFGDVDGCELAYDARVIVTGTRADVVLDAQPVPTADVVASAKLTAPLSPQTPSWAMPYSVALPVPKKPAPIAAASSIEDLACDVVVKQKRFDVDGSAPDPIVRATIGLVRSRATTLGLGRNVTSARFVVHGANVVVGERVRLSVTSAGDRSLGGAIVTFDGSTPLLLENAAFRATCTAAPAVADDVVDAAVLKAEAAIAVLAADDNGIASPRPDIVLRKKREQAAEAAVVGVAALVGFDHTSAVAVVDALDAAR